MRTSLAATPFTCQTAALVPAARFLRPGFALSLHSPQRRGGGAPRIVRVLARHPLGLHVTRQARRWRGALRPSEDARLPALHRGGFWLRCRASLTSICAGSVPASSSHRVVVPGGGVPYLPGQRLPAAAAGRHALLLPWVKRGLTDNCMH